MSGLSPAFPIPASVGSVASDPVWLPHRYDPDHDAVHFVRLDREGHDAVTFLIDAMLPAGLPKLVLRRDETGPVARTTAAPIHFIFHSAYCCSTLLARAFDRAGLAMGLKEPQILNDMVGWQRRGGDPLRVLDNVLDLLAQPFANGEMVVVKPSSVINNSLAVPILARRPEAKALLLHAPLPNYLRSIARKGMWGALWVREYFGGARKDGIVDLGFDDDQFFGQTDLQIAAMGWLAQHALFARLITQFGPERVRSLDSETLLANRDASITALTGLFGGRLDAEGARSIAEGSAFTRHSKSATPFGPDDRARDQDAAADRYREEIEKVSIWTEAVAHRAGISMTLGAPLLGG